MGRPSDFSQRVADEICEEMAQGKSLSSICAQKNMPHRATVYRWMDEHESFRDNYARARDQRADKFAEEIIEIADTEEDAQKARNRIDARKWAAGKLAPKRYGDRTIVAGDDENPLNSNVTLSADQALSEVLGRLARLAERE